ncbi:Ras-related protein Rab-3B [Orchesella cincta]|uniref:Ras-related protein Rab-3B n=1 Tax=Orchesella cincta TaxID=48709 RepID=A0A1D2MBJ8_ORCCI|nr:Ras-related protein Rab-3B [Orchesella cincta]
MKSSLSHFLTFRRCPMNCSEEITEDSLRRIFGVPMSSTSTIPNNATGGQNQSDPSIDYTFKVILLGQGGVGKTCVLCRYSVS